MVDQTAPDPSDGPSLATVLTAAQSGSATMDQLIATFLETTVVVPSATDPTTTPIQPVLVDVNGVKHVAVFDSLESAARVTNLASFAASMRGRDIARATRPELGILVSTASSGFDLSTALLSEIREKDRA